ncbi:hypothetical protein ACQZ4O_16045 [Agrobacterium vitis]
MPAGGSLRASWWGFPLAKTDAGSGVDDLSHGAGNGIAIIAQLIGMKPHESGILHPITW